MNSDAIHQSFWYQQSGFESSYPELRGKHRCEVAVIGAGITGLSVALELLHRGRNVAVCEASVIGTGTTGGSTGHLDASPEIGAWKLLDRLGQPAGASYVDLRVQAINAIEHRAGDTCDFQRVPAYQYSDDPGDRSILQREFEAARELGLSATWEDQVPFPGAACGFRIDHMARFDCLAYHRRLADMVRAAGGQIFENTLVESHPDGDSNELNTAHGTLQFDHVVSATHCNYTGSYVLDMRVPAYQSYVLAAHVSDPPPDALFWDNSDPYFYVRRVNRDGDLVLIGGCDHRTGDGDTKDAEQQLEAFARQHFDVQSIVSRWSAELFEPTDGLPLIGRAPGMDNVWIATGLSGVGLTWGTAAGWLIADQIAGRASTLSDQLSPLRFSSEAVLSTLGEQWTPAKSYARRVLPTHDIDLSELKPGQGEVGKVDGQHTAACRDLDGKLHLCDPVCEHMGGVVSWNESAQTWDCPVHGGRYANCGKRLYGPPRKSLKSNAEAKT